MRATTCDSDEEVLAWLRAEHARPFAGWDFSYLHGRRWQVGEKPWDLETILREALPRSAALLDLGTGDGRFLAGLKEQRPFPPRACATEGYPPNVPIARARLETLGISVHEVADGARLPFPDGSFDLVTSRHMAYDAGEVGRVLQAGGRLVTQQVGDQTNLDLHRLLGSPKAAAPAWNLAVARSQLEAAGFRIEQAAECFPTTRYRDVGALVYYLKGVSWEIPDFSVDRYAEPLLALHRRVQQAGHLDIGFHLFLLVAEKRG